MAIHLSPTWIAYRHRLRITPYICYTCRGQEGLPGTVHSHPLGTGGWEGQTDREVQSPMTSLDGLLTLYTPAVVYLNRDLKIPQDCP